MTEGFYCLFTLSIKSFCVAFPTSLKTLSYFQLCSFSSPFIFPPGSFSSLDEGFATMAFLPYSAGLDWSRQWHRTPVLLPGKSHGWRNLVGCSPWGLKESDTTERLHFHFSLSCIGEGNGNPLQCSWLENPRDRGAWWAAVYGVAQESDTTEETQQQQRQLLWAG